jgi:hypothetical protein
MTVLQIYLFSALYLIIFTVVALLTHPTLRRIAGALAGGAVAGVAALGMIACGEWLAWWHFVMSWEPYYLISMVIGFAITTAFVFLITWRVARRFGWRGLTVVLIAVAIIGPPRDYWYMERFPEWGTFGPGLAPVLADAAAYVLFVGLGHGVMRVVAGPASGDRLARRPWEKRGIQETRADQVAPPDGPRD